MATGRKADADASPAVGFSEGLFRFLGDLKRHNDREWFQKNKARYEADARDPMLRFIEAFGRPLAGVSRQFEADPRPSGGSMFRIYRDTRFAKDKSPYKTHVAAHFHHRGSGKDGVHGPGFYLHLEPGASFAGGGLWHPDTESLLKVRQAIAGKPRAWKSVRKPGLELLGDTLKRVPPGFDPAHPFADDLKHRDFYVGTSFSDDEVLSPRFLATVTAACRGAAPLVAFICEATGMPW